MQTDWENAKPAPEVDTTQLLRPLDRHARRARSRPLRLHPRARPTAFPTRPRRAIASCSMAKCSREGSLRARLRPFRDGQLQCASRRFTHRAAGDDISPKCLPFAFDFADTKPHDFQLEYSHSGDQSGGGLTLKWEAPAQAQLDEAVARAKEADVVVAFVGLSPQLEGEEMRIKIRRLRAAATAPASICPRRNRNCLKPWPPPASRSSWCCKAAARWRSTGPTSTQPRFLKPGIPASRAERPSPAPWPDSTIPPGGCLSPFMPVSTACPPSPTTR